MELSLTRADQDFADEVRTWLAEHLVGDFARCGGVGGPADDEAWEVRVAWDRELAAGGWLGLSWPAEYGGRGLSLRHEVIFAIESARANPPYRACVQGLELLGPMLLARGTDEQKLRFLPPILRVEEFWGQGFSEPGAGSDLASLTTRAWREEREGGAGGDWVIDGQKTWTTTGNRADWLYVLARTEAGSARHRGLTMLLVPARQPGVDIRPIRNLTGAAEFCETFLRGARTAADMAVGDVGGGWGVAMAALGTERGTSLVAQQMGFSREVARLTEALGVPAPAVRHRLVDAWIGARIARWQVLRLMETILRDGDPGLRPSISKVYASSFHQRLGTLALDLLDAAGQVTGSGYELGEMQRTALACLAESIYGGTTEIQMNLIAERALGLPKEGAPALNFDFDEDQEELRRTVRRFLERMSAEADVRRLMATEPGYDPAAWEQMAAQLGLHGLAIPEEYGGAGFSFVELGVVLEEMGRVLLCAPFFASVVLAAELLKAVDDEQARKDYLPQIASGETIATVAITEADGQWQSSSVATQAVPGEGGGGAWRVTGTKNFVPDGASAGRILVVARTEAGIGVFAVDGQAPGLSRQLLPTMDQTRKQARLDFDSVPARPLGDPGNGWPAVSRMLQVAAVGLAAEQVGGAQRALEMAVEYAKLREQFGRPIGSFQAIKHKCASMLVAVESMKSAAYYGLWAVAAGGDELPVVSSIAKVCCSDGYTMVTSENIQIHGGIGFTWEHPAHLYFKRARSSRVLLGGPDYHRDLIARLAGIIPPDDSNDRA